MPVSASITGSRVQKLHAALVEPAIGRGPQQVIREIHARNAALKTERSVGTADVSFVDLQVTEFAAEFESVIALDLGKAITEHPGVIGLGGGQRGDADVEFVEAHLWHILRKSRRP